MHCGYLNNDIQTFASSYDGPDFHKCQGCKIDWKEGKNVTVKTIKKKQVA
jgi:hypothetical protein